MFKAIKALAAVAVLGAMSACADTDDVEEFVIAEPAPVSVEPVYTGKYN